MRWFIVVNNDIEAWKLLFPLLSLSLSVYLFASASFCVTTASYSFHKNIPTMSRPSGLKISLLEDIANNTKDLEPGHTRTYKEIDFGTAAAVIDALGLEESFKKSHLRLGYNAHMEELTITVPTRIHDCVNIWIRRVFAQGERKNYFSEHESDYLEIDGDTGQCLPVCYSPVPINNGPESSGFPISFTPIYVPSTSQACDKHYCLFLYFTRDRKKRYSINKAL